MFHHYVTCLEKHNESQGETHIPSESTEGTNVASKCKIDPDKVADPDKASGLVPHLVHELNVGMIFDSLWGLNVPKVLESILDTPCLQHEGRFIMYITRWDFNRHKELTKYSFNFAHFTKLTPFFDCFIDYFLLHLFERLVLINFIQKI
jgi:hypothetical protein